MMDAGNCFNLRMEFWITLAAVWFKSLNSNLLFVREYSLVNDAKAAFSDNSISWKSFGGVWQLFKTEITPWNIINLKVSLFI